MERRHIQAFAAMGGYDALQQVRSGVSAEPYSYDLTPNRAYDEYHRLHKALIPAEQVPRLEGIYKKLRQECLPDYLDVAAWSAAEVALIDEDRPTAARIELLEAAEISWQRALGIQEQINHDERLGYMHEDVASYRIALSIAFVPLMKAIAVGDITAGVRERVFSDVLAIAQTAGLQRLLAERHGAIDTVGDMLGFEHECNAHLALLHMDDPRYVPLPSTARGGSGYDHHRETHDIMVVNQHWGSILKIVPVEVKSKASLNDLKRYEALIIRGKMHLSITGLFTPDHTRTAFAAHYEGIASRRESATVSQVTDTIKRLLQLYQRGERQNMASDGRTRYHDTDALVREHPEFSLDRPRKY